MKSFTYDLARWIDTHLDRTLSVDIVSARAGYSKWHLQRFFLRETGLNIAEYIRHRRLTEAAVALKMTSSPIAEISDSYAFSNQQAFTRVFTRHFGIPPGEYRRSPGWDFSRYQPALLPSGTMPINAEKVLMRPLPLSGLALSYTSDVAQLSSLNFHLRKRKKIISEIAGHFPGLRVSSVSETFSPGDRANTVQFEMNFHESAVLEECVPSQHSAPDATAYLRFSVRGDHKQFLEDQLTIYTQHLPSLKAVRGAAADVLVLNPTPVTDLISLGLRGKYYIPINSVSCNP